MSAYAANNTLQASTFCLGDGKYGTLRILQHRINARPVHRMYPGRGGADRQCRRHFACRGRLPVVDSSQSVCHRCLHLGSRWDMVFVLRGTRPRVLVGGLVAAADGSRSRARELHAKTRPAGSRWHGVRVSSHNGGLLAAHTLSLGLGVALPAAGPAAASGPVRACANRLTNHSGTDAIPLTIGLTVGRLSVYICAFIPACQFQTS